MGGHTDPVTYGLPVLEKHGYGKHDEALMQSRPATIVAVRPAMGGRCIVHVRGTGKDVAHLYPGGLKALIDDFGSVEEAVGRVVEVREEGIYRDG